MPAARRKWRLQLGKHGTCGAGNRCNSHYVMYASMCPFKAHLAIYVSIFFHLFPFCSIYFHFIPLLQSFEKPCHLKTMPCEMKISSSNSSSIVFVVVAVALVLAALLLRLGLLLLLFPSLYPFISTEQQARIRTDSQSQLIS